MMLQPVSFSLSLTIQAPFLSHKAGAQQFGYDMSMLKDMDGYPVFLGSLIRGNIRHTLHYFNEILQSDNEIELSAEITQVLSHFGSHSSDVDNAPSRANFNFDFYWKIADKTYPKNKIPRCRIGIDEETGTVKQGNLQIIEAPYQQGQLIQFTGCIKASLTESDAKIAKKWLHKAVLHISSIGALKGTGFGKVQSVELKQIESTESNQPNSINDDRIGISLTLDRPLCIAKPHTLNHNRFSSEEHIPGNVILGTIAKQFPTVIEQDQKQKESNQPHWFNQLIVTHAIPTADEEKLSRNAVLPLSLVTISSHNANGKRVIDLAHSKPQQDKALLIKLDAKIHSPTYQPDWKDEDRKQAIDQTNQSINTDKKPTPHYVSRQLIVRTGIEEGQTFAKEGALFSLDCINPKQTQWCADIDFSAISDLNERKHAKETIATVIASGLQGIGKTKAIASIQQQEKSFYQAASKITPQNGYYIITLQTAAHLFTTATHIKATADADSLKKCYQGYWQKVSEGNLILSHYFAQQSKVGGEFYWRYYQKGKAYQPLWLTNAGSVFVLTASTKGKQTEIEKILNQWLTHGLPPVPDKKELTWQDTPYIRENGFGEIRLNDSIHHKLSIEEQALEGIWL